MKITNLYTLMIAMTCVLLLSSCFVEEIELDLNNQGNKKVVITAWLNDLDEDQYVQVSYSQDYFDDTQLETINDATVTLSYASETLTLIASENGKYLVPLNYKVQAGIEYTLSVSHKEIEYRAVSTHKDMPDIQEIEPRLFVDQSDSLSYYEIYFGFQETPGEGDGYFAIDYIKNSDQKNIIRTGGWTDDEFEDGEYYGNITVTQNYHQLGDTIILEAHSVGKKATEYFESISSEIFRDGLLSPPPVNVPTNFSNGAVGYFLSSSKKEYQIIIE